jgi:hypothetical protein
MNTKPLFYFGCFLVATLATSTIDAGQHHRGNHAASRPARNGGFARTFAHSTRVSAWKSHNWNGQHWNGSWSGKNWSGHNWSGNNWNWHHHHHRRSSVVFLDFGFPFWGWGGYPSYYYDYSPYGYYPYGSSYGYYGGGYGSYNYNYGNGYGNEYGYGNSYDAKVAELQRRLTNAGYYRGEIDGIFGLRTKYALRAYRHDHPNGNDNNNSGRSPTLRDRPYSPPPVTREPSQSDE